MHTRQSLTTALSVLATLALTASVVRAEPPRISLAVDQGFIVGNGTPYAFGAKLLPAVDAGRFRLANVVGVVFANPEWDIVLGVSPSFVIYAPVTSGTGVRFVVEGVVEMLAQEARITGGFVFDFDGIHFGQVAGYDSLHRAAIVLSTVGIDLPRLVSFVGDDPF